MAIQRPDVKLQATRVSQNTGGRTTPIIICNSNQLLYFGRSKQKVTAKRATGILIPVLRKAQNVSCNFMTRIIILTFLTLFAVTKTTAQKNPTIDFPKVGLTISLSKNTFTVKDDILVQMVVTNNSKTNQKVLFDKPKSSTGGPAHTVVLLTNKKTGKSALKYQNKRVLESQVYNEEQLKDKYYNLGTGQSIKGQYNLFELAVTTLDNYRLAKGTYELQVFYYSNPSNKLTFTIE